MRRLGSQEADQVLQERGISRADHYPEREEQDAQPFESRPPEKFTPGLAPVEETDSVDTSQTEEEKKEIRRREKDALQEYYNKYRNPLARLRARYPEAPAEFLAVSTPFFHIRRNTVVKYCRLKHIRLYDLHAYCAFMSGVGRRYDLSLLPSQY